MKHEGLKLTLVGVCGGLLPMTLDEQIQRAVERGEMIPWDFDSPPDVAEGPAYTILHDAARFAEWFLNMVDFSDIAPEGLAAAWAERFDYAVGRYLDLRTALTFSDRHEVSLN